MRHEIGHYYQDDPGRRKRRRRATSAARCSATTAPTTPPRSTATTPAVRRRAGRDGYVSAYATMHPWEDWAETFAHYLHIRDTLQTAAAYGMRVDGPQVATTDSAPLHSDPDETRPTSPGSSTPGCR